MLVGKALVEQSVGKKNVQDDGLLVGNMWPSDDPSVNNADQPWVIKWTDAPTFGPIRARRKI
jgi:hypothetical protein